MKLFNIFIFCVCVLFKLSGEEPCLYLTSREDVAEKFIEKVREEKERICLVTPRLSQLDVVDALIEAYRRNVQVEVIVDSFFISMSSPLHRLIREGIAVWVWQPRLFPPKCPPSLPGPYPKKKVRIPQKRMNHSFCVFGSDECWTGSYAFSVKSKFPPLENAVLFRSEKLAKEFLEEFGRMKKKHVVSLPLYLQQKEVSP